MYVKVKFFRKSANGYVGNAYTYETDGQGNSSGRNGKEPGNCDGGQCAAERD